MSEPALDSLQEANDTQDTGRKRAIDGKRNDLTPSKIPLQNRKVK